MINMPTNPRLVQLKEEFDANRSGLDYLDALAAQEKRDLSADERTKYDVAIARMDVIEAEIPQVLERTARYDAVAESTKGIVAEKGRSVHADGTTRSRSEFQFDPSQARPAHQRDSDRILAMGEFALEVGRARIGRVTGKVSHEEYEETLNRWDVNPDNEMGRVVAHGVAADGTAPVTIEGDLIKFVDANRYAVNAARQLPMPDNHAPTFKRPRITQRTTVAQQVTEGDVLSSQRIQATGDTVTKRTEGGVLSLSEQEIDWTDPAMLGLSIEDLAESYAIDTDTVLTAAIATAAALNDANEQVLAAALPTSAAFVAAITGAAAQVFSTSRKFPDTIFCDINWWGRIAGIVDLDGRPVFPMANPQNNFGTGGGLSTPFGYSVLGLNLVVDPNFAADTLLVARSSLVEFYEQNKGLLTINVPSTLEVQYAYRGYVAANVYSQGLGLIEAV